MSQYFECYGRLIVTGMVIFAVLSVIFLVVEGFKLIFSFFQFM